MTARTIPITRPSFGPSEFEAVKATLDSGWVLQGPRVAEFETRFAAMVGSEHAVAMSSCTTALHASVVALGAGPGDEVVVPAFTWVATANVVEQTGAKPVFADIDLDTFNLDERGVPNLITDRTVGIVPVHLFGLSADLESVSDALTGRALWMLEDAACGLGAERRGEHVGTTGQIGCFSFHPRKSITTGEGGMAVTDDARLAGILRSLRDHGSEPLAIADEPASAAMPCFPRLGFNYRMTDIQGAIGVAQLERANAFIEARQRIAARYDQGLGDLDWLRIPRVPDGHTHAYQSYVLLVTLDTPTDLPSERAAQARDGLMRTLERAGIGCRPGTHAPPLTDFYRERYGYRPEDFPAAAIAERLSVALPIFPGLHDDEIDYVIDSIRAYEPLRMTQLV
jgi:dTDP-4-amino-4,6-dideoxygalactose transaminase